MTSRERLLCALRHGIPDRVPVSTYDMTGWRFDPRDDLPAQDPLADYVQKQLLGMYMTGWWNREPSYQPLMAYIREHADCTYMTTVPVGNAYAASHTHYKQWVEGPSTYTQIILETPKGPLSQTFRVDEGVYTAWETEHLLKDEGDIARYLSVPFDPLPVDTSHLKAQDEYIGDHGILMIDINDPVCEVFSLFGFTEFLVQALTEADTIVKLLDFCWERQEHFLTEMLRKGAGPLFRVAGPEVCTPPYLPKACFRRFVTQYDKKLVDLVHRHGGYVRAHSHGKVATVLDEFLEMGVDALDPVESSRYGDGDLTLAEAKRAVGDRICLFGNIQLKDLELLPAKEMRETIKQCVLEGKPGGNFVALPTATPLNVPLSPRTEENFRILIDTVHEYGEYD